MQYMKYLEEAKEKTKKYEETMHCKNIFLNFLQIVLFLVLKPASKEELLALIRKENPNTLPNQIKKVKNTTS